MENPTVLVVDDDPVARTLIGRLLQGHGYDVQTAEDAYSAIAVARATRPDAVVLDFRLPGGDALVVLDRLRKLPALAAVPVVVVSAVDRSVHEGAVKRAGATAFLQKPFEAGELLEVVARSLRQAGPPPADGAIIRHDAR